MGSEDSTTLLSTLGIKILAILRSLNCVSGDVRVTCDVSPRESHIVESQISEKSNRGNSSEKSRKKRVVVGGAVSLYNHSDYVTYGQICDVHVDTKYVFTLKKVENVHDREGDFYVIIDSS